MFEFLPRTEKRQILKCSTMKGRKVYQELFEAALIHIFLSSWLSFSIHVKDILRN